ncbi:MAG: hypothetical protein IPJ18_00130 [Betaproteobacteria bacterium]|nr:hypothetical protein [Betaproteobacteria bacterium]
MSPVVIAHPLAFGVIAAFKQAWPHTRVVVAHLALTSLRSSDGADAVWPIPIPVVSTVLAPLAVAAV